MSAAKEARRQRNQWQAYQMARADQGIQPVFVPQAAEPIVDIINSAPDRQPEMITALAQEDVRIEGVVFTPHERTMVETVAMRNAKVRASFKETANNLLDTLQEGEVKIVGAAQAVDNHIGAVVYGAGLISGALQLRYQTPERIEPIRNATARIAEVADRVVAPFNSALDTILSHPVVAKTTKAAERYISRVAPPVATGITVTACASGVGQEPTPIVIHVDKNGREIQPETTPLAQPTQEALPTAAQPERPRTFFPEGISPWTQGMLSHYNQMDEIVVRPPGDSYRDNTIALLTAAFGYDAQGRHDPNAEVAEVGLGGAIGPLHRYEMDVITPNPDIPENRFNRHQAVLKLVGPSAAGDPHPPGTLYFWTGASGLDPASMSAEEFRSAGFYVVTPPEGGRLETRFHDCVDGETGSSQQCTLVGIDADGNQVFHIDPETGHKLTPDPDNPDIVTISSADDSEDLGKFINGDQIPPALDGYSYQINNGEVNLIDQQGNISHRLDESGEWVEVDDIGKLIVEANDLGKETIIVTDPNGLDVDIDVVPKHIVENASWDWAYRGFVRENNGTTQVYRTLQGVGENDRGRWFNIMSEMEVSGYGVVTIEYDSEEMIRGREANSVRGFGNIELVSPEHWRTVLETLWGNKQVVDFTEVEDLTQLRTHSLFGTETYLTTVPDNWINEKKINSGTGVSFVIRGDNPSHYSQAEFYNDEPTYTFQMAVNNNRPIVELYALYWEYNDQRLDDSNIIYKGIGVLDFMLQQTGLESIRAMLREDGNPWRSIPGNQPSPTHMRALRAVGAPDIIPQGWEVPLARVSSEDDRD